MNRDSGEALRGVGGAGARERATLGVALLAVVLHA